MTVTTKSMRQIQKELRQEADKKLAAKKKKEEINLLYNFQVNFIPTLIFRFLSIYVFISLFDFLNSDFLAYKEFVPFLIKGSKTMILAKTLAVIACALIGTPQVEAQATIHGVKCHVDIKSYSQSMDEAICASDISTCGFEKYFWDIQTIRWDQIHYAKKSLKLLNPIINFYDKNENHLGFMYFSLLEQDKFFDFVREHAGDTHPLLHLEKGA